MMKYSTDTNKGTLKVCRKCGNAMVKVRLRRTYDRAKHALIVLIMYLK